MKSKKKEYVTPKFHSLDEEDKYWWSNSPLLDGCEGKVQKEAQNRTSFLSVRLTEDELANLREAAIALGLGPSTYARMLIVQGMDSRRVIAPDFVMHLLRELTKESEESDPKDPAERYFLFNDIYRQYIDFQDQFFKSFYRQYRMRLAQESAPVPKRKD